MNSYILKGNICYSPTAVRLAVHEGAFVVCESGICRGVYDEIPESFRKLEVIDCGDRLILPGLIDLHIHAAQFALRGTGMDYELLDWLEQVAFPEEIRFADRDYAAKAYGIFAERLKRSATTRAVMFATIHTEATLQLMDYMEQSGLVSCVGKVSMDRNALPMLLEKTSAEAEGPLSAEGPPPAEGPLPAAESERRFIEMALRQGYRRTRPIITPRFVPCCTDRLMEELGQLRSEYQLPVQSHLSENPDEVALVRDLVPDSAFYGEVYDRYGLFGRGGNTIMAHCVYSTPEEMQRLKDNGVWVAHCPSSNTNLASGIAPVRRYLDAGLRVGLGSDVSGGTSESMFRAVTDAIQVSKLYWRFIDPSAKPLTLPEAFWMATRGGGSFFGKVGSFEDGFAFDALVLNDSAEAFARPLPARVRLERAFYLGLDRNGIEMKFVDGERIL